MTLGVERLHAVAVALHVLGRLREAETGARQALARLTEDPGADGAALAAVTSDLAAILDSSGQHPQAEILHRRAGGLLVSLPPGGAGDRLRVRCARGLAANLRAQSRHGEAPGVLVPALGYAEQLLGPDDPDTLATMVDLAAVCVRLGWSVAAERLFRQALARLEVNWAANPSEVAAVTASLSAVLETTGKPEEAAALARSALVTAARTVSERPAGLVPATRLAELVTAPAPPHM